MSNLRELYEKKRFAEFEVAVKNSVLIINEAVKIILGDTAEFDEKGFIKSYIPSKNKYEIDENELFYKMGLIKFGYLLTESYFHNFLNKVDFSVYKESSCFIDDNLDVEIFICSGEGDVVKKFLRTKRKLLLSEDDTPKTNKCILNKENNTLHIVYNSHYSNNNFYIKEDGSYVIVSIDDLRLIDFKIDKKNKIIVDGIIVSGEIL